MKITTAYSTDLERTVDIEEAYELFWENQIADKKKFECAYENCDMQITAANLDKLRENMKRDPYFTTRKSHGPLCSSKREYKNVSNKEVSRNRVSVEKSPVIYLCASRPYSHYQVERTSATVDNTTHNGRNAKDRNRRKREGDKTHQETPRRYSITPLISRYAKLRKRVEKNFPTIVTDKYSASMDEIFVKINNQRIEELCKYERIYYNQADVRRLINGNYRIGFQGSFVYNGDRIKPSLFVNTWVLEKAYNKKLKVKKLDHYASRDEPVWAFAYSSRESIEINNERRYLNFSVTNMDFLDLRDHF